VRAGERDEAVDRPPVAVHRVHPFHHQPAAAEAPGVGGEQAVERVGVGVRDDAHGRAVRACEPAAVHERGVVERVGVDRVARAGEGGEGAGVGRVPAREKERPLRVLQRGQLGLEPVVQRVVAAQQAGGAGAEPLVAEDRRGRRRGARVRGEAQIVVAGEVHERRGRGRRAVGRGAPQPGRRPVGRAQAATQPRPRRERPARGGARRRARGTRRGGRAGARRTTRGEGNAGRLAHPAARGDGGSGHPHAPWPGRCRLTPRRRRPWRRPPRPARRP
jgi:hypothetical protein